MTVSASLSGANNLLVKARAAIYRGHRIIARQLLHRVLANDPDNWQAWLALAAISAPRASLVYIELVLANQPDDSTALKAKQWAEARLPETFETPPKTEDIGDTQPVRPVTPDTLPPAQTAGSIASTQPIRAVSAAQTVQPGRRVATSNTRPGRHPPAKSAPLLQRFFYLRHPQTNRINPILILLLVLVLTMLGMAGFLAFQSVMDSNMPNEIDTLGFVSMAVTATPTATLAPTDTPPPTDMPTALPAATATPPTPTNTPLPPTVTNTAVPPTPTNVPPLPTATVASVQSVAPGLPRSGRWIDVDLSAQKTYAMEGDRVVREFVVSTGLPQTPTVTGQYRVYIKYTSATMSGPDYYLTHVPWIMYFYRGYGFHGTYWHDNFGNPMSHGCVNMRTGEAEWLFNFAAVGTLVNVHY